VFIIVVLSSRGERKKKTVSSLVPPRSGNLAGLAGYWAELMDHSQVNPSPFFCLYFFSFFFFFVLV
jgi:hypothetical protein